VEGDLRLYKSLHIADRLQKFKGRRGYPIEKDKIEDIKTIDKKICP
jgi:hypothetical protein